MKIYKILKNTSVEGPGKRFCIWTQGCKKHCDGCYAKDTWDFEKGEDISIQNLYKMIEKEKDYVEGVTFLGGEPFEQAKELYELCEKIKNLKLSIVCFSGYTKEELENKNDIFIQKALGHIDLLIDGGFEKEKFDLSRPWVGSANQRFIFLTDRYSYDDILKYKNKIELRISDNGRFDINGMGDFEKIEKDFCLQLGKNIVK